MGAGWRRWGWGAAVVRALHWGALGVARACVRCAACQRRHLALPRTAHLCSAPHCPPPPSTGLPARLPGLHAPLRSAAGMIQAKGMGKKKRREKSKGLDRGLMEDGGAFRPGLLRVKGSAAAAASSGGGGKGKGGKRRK